MQHTFMEQYEQSDIAILYDVMCLGEYEHPISHKKKIIFQSFFKTNKLHSFPNLCRCKDRPQGNIKYDLSTNICSNIL